MAMDGIAALASLEALKLEAEGNAVSVEELKKPFESWLKIKAIYIDL